MKELNNLQLKAGDVIAFSTSSSSILDGAITDASDRSLVSVELSSGKVIKIGRKSIIRKLMSLGS